MEKERSALNYLIYSIKSRMNCGVMVNSEIKGKLW